MKDAKYMCSIAVKATRNSKEYKAILNTIESRATMGRMTAEYEGKMPFHVAVVLEEDGFQIEKHPDKEAVIVHWDRRK